MSTDVAMHLLAQTLLVAVKVSAPILLATLVVGLIISVLQVVTQIQEMTLTFLPKLLAVVVVCLICGGWMLNVVAQFAKHLIGTIAG